MQIPLADLLVHLRADLRTPGAPSTRRRTPVARRRRGFGIWSRVWSHPSGYRASTALGRAGARLLGRRGWARRAPGLSGWTSGTRPAAAGAHTIPSALARSRPGGRTVVTALTDAFAEKATSNACVVHGPFPTANAAGHVVEVVATHARGGEVAVPEHDALVDHLDLPRRLAAADVRLLWPSDDGWDTRLADAAAGVTSASIAVAATGTLAVVAGPGAPRAQPAPARARVRAASERRRPRVR